MKKIAMYFIKLYQKYISPMKPMQTCGFLPTCSQYALESYEIHGFFKGTLLSVRRLSQCRPGSKYSGYDPVPEKGSWNNGLDTRKK